MTVLGGVIGSELIDCCFRVVVMVGGGLDVIMTCGKDGYLFLRAGSGLWLIIPSDVTKFLYSLIATSGGSVVFSRMVSVV